MLVELGPVPAGDVQRWTKFARRVIAELRVDPGDLEGVANDDQLRQWSQLIDEWAAIASEREQFRWSKALDPELGEFLLHGLERCLHSPGVLARITDEEVEAQRPFTLHVIAAFVAALRAEGVAHEHYADQIRALISHSFE